LEKQGLVRIESVTEVPQPILRKGRCSRYAPRVDGGANGRRQCHRPGARDDRAAFLLATRCDRFGKTEVYLHAVKRCLELGRGALVLVPEIALTPQLVGRFRARLGDTIAVVHSALSEGERHQMWKSLRSGQVRVAVGARSALFCAGNKLGLICGRRA